MAIITCPQCQNRISDRAATCSHCGLLLSGVSAEKLEQTRRLSRSTQLNKLIGHQMKAMLLFIIGIAMAFYNWHDPENFPDFLMDSWVTADILHKAGFFIMFIGLAWYTIARVRIFNLKRMK